MTKMKFKDVPLETPFSIYECHWDFIILREKISKFRVRWTDNRRVVHSEIWGPNDIVYVVNMAEIAYARMIGLEGMSYDQNEI